MIWASTADFVGALPLFILAAAGMLVIVLEAFSKGAGRQFLMPLTVLSAVGAAVAAYVLSRSQSYSIPLFSGMLQSDPTGHFFVILFCIGIALTAMLMPAHQEEHDWEVGETYGLLLLAGAGMAMIAQAGDLVAVFLGIETMSLAVYVMTALRRSRRSSEASMKYFLMGAVATGFLVYGMALLYGATGGTRLSQIAEVLAQGENLPLAVMGSFMLVIAFGFKIAAVPFHMWAPDAYDGAPTPVTGFMAASVKCAAFAGLYRVFGGALGGTMALGDLGWGQVFAILAAATMTFGNIAALRQESIKRLLAYSSISHAGVLLVGVVAAGLDPSVAPQARQAILFYLAAYTFTTLGAFAVLVWVSPRSGERTMVDQWNGMAQSRPLAALAMTIFLLSLGGMPPTAGFFGKFMMFKTAMQASGDALVWLVIIGVLNSVISIYYYLRIVIAMYFKEPNGEFVPVKSIAVAMALGICMFFVLQMGILPGTWLWVIGS